MTILITALAEGRNNTLWVGTQKGLNHFEPDTGNFERFLHSDRKPESITSDMITSLLMDSTGNLWVGTTSGLDRLSGAGNDFIHYRMIRLLLKA